MAQRPSGSASRRTKAAPVRQPFPWGVAASWAALAVLLGGILFYAATHQGEGFSTALKRADASFGDGLRKDTGLPRQHRLGQIRYGHLPPDGGNHNPQWESCQVYTQQIPNEHAVHSLEHGAVWVTYRPDLPADKVAVLAGEVRDNPFRMLSPFPGQTHLISLQAWGRQYATDKANDPKIAKFLDLYTQGPQTPEPGNTCRGGTTVTGPVPQGPPTGSPAPALPPTVAPGASAPTSTAPSAATPTSASPNGAAPQPTHS